MDGGASGSPSGIVASLKRIGDRLLAIVAGRLQLLSIELQEEKLRALDLLLWLAVGFGLCLIGLVMAGVAVALFVEALLGVGGLAVVAVAILGGAAGIFWHVRNKLKTGPPPFAQTIAELKKDRECLRPKD